MYSGEASRVVVVRQATISGIVPSLHPKPGSRVFFHSLIARRVPKTAVAIARIWQPALPLTGHCFRPLTVAKNVYFPASAPAILRPVPPFNGPFITPQQNIG